MVEVREHGRHHVDESAKGAETWNACVKQTLTYCTQTSEISVSQNTIPIDHLVKMDVTKRRPRINLDGINLKGADLRYTGFADISMFNADLQGSILTYANLENTNLGYAKIKGATLSAVTLKKANLHNANLEESDFTYADLRGADLEGANLSGGILYGANLQGDRLLGANLSSATLKGTNLNDANVAAVKFSRDSRQEKFRGIRVATCYGSQTFKSFAQDQDYIEELSYAALGWLKFWIWYIFADCGRSFVRWAALVFGIRCGFRILLPLARSAPLL